MRTFVYVLVVFLLGLLVLDGVGAATLTYYDVHGRNLGSPAGTSGAGKNQVNFTTTVDLLSVERYAGTTWTTAKIYNDSHDTQIQCTSAGLGSCTADGSGYCNFSSPIHLNANTTYTVCADSGGTTYNYVFSDFAGGTTGNTTLVKYVTGWFTNGAATDGRIVNINGFIFNVTPPEPPADPVLTISLNDSVTGSLIGGFCINATTNATVTSSSGSGQWFVINGSETGANSKTYLQNYEDLVGGALLANVNSTVQYAVSGTTFLTVPEFQQSTACGLTNASLQTTYFGTATNSTTYEVRSDAYSEAGIVLAMSNRTNEFHAWYNFLTIMDICGYGNLPCWVIGRNQTLGGNQVGLAGGQNDTAIDGSVRAGIALYIAVNNSAMTAANRSAYLALANNITRDSYNYETISITSKNTRAGVNVTRIPMGGGDCAAAGIGCSTDMWIGYAGDIIKLFQLGCFFTGNQTYCAAAANFTAAFYSASIQNDTDGDGFGVAPFNFNWNTATSYLGHIDGGGVNSYHYAKTNPQWDDSDAPRFENFCDILRIQNLTVGSITGPYLNASQYCRDWSETGQYNVTTSGLQYYYNGTCASNCMATGLYENGLGAMSSTYWNTTILSPKINETLTHYSWTTYKYDSTSCGNILMFRGSKAGKALGAAIGLDARMVSSLVTSSNSVANSTILCNATGNTISIVNITGTYNFTAFNITSGNVTPRWFNVTRLNYVFDPLNTSLVLPTYQAIINLVAYRLFINTSIASFNGTNGLVSNTSGSGSLTLLATGGINNVIVGVVGNYSLSKACNATFLSSNACAATGVYDGIFEINATDALSGLPVSNFTVRTSNSTLGGNVVNSTTTNGTAYVPLLQGYWYNFLIDGSPTFSFANVTIPSNASANNYSFSLLEVNTLFLFFYDSVSLLPILHNVTVTSSSGNVTFLDSSTTGSMVVSTLTLGLWTIAVSSPLYSTADFFVTMVTGDPQNLDVYLLNSSTASDTTMTIKDASTGGLIIGATVTLQLMVAGNWVTFDQQTSDVFGVASFSLVQGEQYQMIVEAGGYSTKTGVFVRTQDAYIVTLSASNSQNFRTFLDDFSYVIAPTEVSPNMTTFSITTSSPEGWLDWFSVSVTLNGTTTLSNVTGSPSGGTASVSINLSGHAGEMVMATYRVRSTGVNDTLELSRNWLIYDLQAGNYTFAEFMDYYGRDGGGELSFAARALILTMVAVVIALAIGSFFGVEAGVVGAAVVYMVGGYFGWINTSLMIVVVSAIIGTIFVASRGGR